MDKNPAAQISKITDSNTQHFFRVNCALRHAVVCRWCCCAPRGDRGVLSYEFKGLLSGSGLSVAHFMQTYVFQCCFVFWHATVSCLRSCAPRRISVVSCCAARVFVDFPNSLEVRHWTASHRGESAQFFFGGRYAPPTTNGLSPAFLCGKTGNVFS